MLAGLVGSGVIAGGGASSPPFDGILDTFTRTNASGLDDTDTGETWEILAGTWGTDGDEGYCVVSSAQAGAVVDATHADGEIEITMGVSTADAGIIVRCADNSNYYVLTLQASTVAIYKREAGAFTQLGTAYTDVADGDVFTVRLSGNTISCYKNDRWCYYEAIYSTFTTQTKWGIRCNTNTTARFARMTIIDDIRAMPSPVWASLAVASGAMGNANTGQAWTDLIGTWEYFGGAINGEFLDHASTVVDSGVSNGEVSVTFYDGPSDGHGLVLRATDADNFLFVSVNPGAGNVTINRMQGAVATVLATLTYTWAAEILTVVLSGTTIQVLADDTVVGSTTSSFNQSATKHGLYAHQSSGATRFRTFAVQS